MKAKEPWPRAAKVYCHRAVEWPVDAEIVERHAVRSCTRRGPAIDLVLARARENRSQLVVTRARGREAIFWQSPRTTKQARPGVHLPTARASGQVLDIVVDTGEKYPYSFGHQQATTRRRRLAAGDYAVELDGAVVAAVERKTLEDLAGSLLSGRLTYALADLTALPRAAVVIEDRYSRLFKLPHASGARLAESLAEIQARFPSVPVVFCESRPLAQEWTYRWLGACLTELAAAGSTAGLESSFAPGGPVPVAPPSSAEIRAWARARGIEVSDRGRIPADIVHAYSEAAGGSRS
ncbi:Lsr2 family DNA-binding protein [Blastococcus brunescens]|uniref:Histone-like nucleoid-structuring protein Lsr2 n=1 Tax=Blastococcus brunescens TaxID=1564165 RepID=A0ABZ1AXB1_9ACTN|nr:histone-like nucleoid-structuring protein Lsr2 [Blastococcus sp. BMG 8361]WRL62146.1 histone-like nucleoid-structuring protein Lsr2 [Blastococcus sp. BMG 8361]